MIFVGDLNWWGTISRPVATFLSKYDFSGKTIVPFYTHEGSRLGRSVEDIAKLCPKSTIMKDLAVRGRDVKMHRMKFPSGCIHKLGMTK